jgi:shikimate kinase
VILKLRQTPGLYLVGFMGSGKTTVGKLLADRLGWGFADIDKDIEASQQRSISDIFDTLGEEAFRRMESEALQARVRSVARGIPMVMALGGGAPAQPGNIELIENHGVTIWLTCPFETVVRRVTQDNPNRPLARDMKKFEELYYARQPAYGRADFRLDSESDDPETVVDAILKLPLFR